MKNKDALKQITARMRDRGLKMTSRRRRVIEVLSRAERPMSADELYGKVSNKINRVTVYRILAALEGTDCVSRFTFQNRHAYELFTAHSHYLTCRKCEKVERLPFCRLGGIERASLRASEKFASVDHHILQLVGVCRKCAA